MVVGLLAIASIGLTFFSLQQMTQEKVIKSYDMTEYGYHKSAPPLDTQTPGPVKIRAEDLLKGVAKHGTMRGKTAEVRYIDLRTRVVTTKSQVPYVSQGGRSTNFISSLRGGKGSFSYGRYTLDVTVPQSVTIRRSLNVRVSPVIGFPGYSLPVIRPRPVIKPKPYISVIGPNVTIRR